MKERDAVIEDLRAVRERSRYKSIGDGRIRDPERADIRIKYMRLIVQAANAERRLLRDKQIDELSERLSRLEGEREPGSASFDIDEFLEDFDRKQKAEAES